MDRLIARPGAARQLPPLAVHELGDLVQRHLVQRALAKLSHHHRRRPGRAQHRLGLAGVVELVHLHLAPQREAAQGLLHRGPGPLGDLRRSRPPDVQPVGPIRGHRPFGSDDLQQAGRDLRHRRRARVGQPSALPRRMGRRTGGRVADGSGHPVSGVVRTGGRVVRCGASRLASQLHPPLRRGRFGEPQRPVKLVGVRRPQQHPLDAGDGRMLARRGHHRPAQPPPPVLGQHIHVGQPPECGPVGHDAGPAHHRAVGPVHPQHHAVGCAHRGLLPAAPARPVALNLQEVVHGVGIEARRVVGDHILPAPPLPWSQLQAPLAHVAKRYPLSCAHDERRWDEIEPEVQHWPSGKPQQSALLASVSGDPMVAGLY